MDKFRYALFWKGYNNIPSKQYYIGITREQSIILQIHELKTTKHDYRSLYNHIETLSYTSLILEQL